MTDCPNGDIRDLLPELLHGRLEPSERARAEQHVATCDACSAELELLRTLRSTMRRAPAIDAAAIAAAIPAYRPPVRQRSWGGWRAAAAIAAIAVGGTSIAIVGRESDAGVRDGVAAARTESTTVSQATPSIAPESAGRTTTSIDPTPAPPTAPVAAAPAAAEPVSLAMTGGAIGELSDGELSTLVNELESLDALPSEDVESSGGFSSLVPGEQSR